MNTTPLVPDHGPWNAQQVFDAALFGIRSQDYKASMLAIDGRRTRNCMYRSTDHKTGKVLACGAGWSIPDSMLPHDTVWKLKATPAASLDQVINTRAIFEDSVTVHDVLACVQAVHDDELPEDNTQQWEDCMKQIADDYGLVYTPPQA